MSTTRLGAAAAAIGIGAAVLSGCASSEPSSGHLDRPVSWPASGWPEPTGEVVEQPAAPTAQPSIPPPAPVPSRLTDNGVFKVGKDIQPGTYSYVVTGHPDVGGYWQRLSCLTGDIDCVITADTVNGPGYMTVEPTDVAVEVFDVQLTPEE